jgi:hypothetical protein
MFLWVSLAKLTNASLLPTRQSPAARVVVRRGKRSIIGMEEAANKQDFDKNDDSKIEEEFDKYFDMPTTTTMRRKTTLPTKDYPFTRRNLKVSGLKYSIAMKKKGKEIMKRR